MLEPNDNGPSNSPRVTPAAVGRLAGPLIAALICTIPSSLTGSLSPEAQRTAAIAAWLAIWWMTEAVPLPITALLPIVLFPLAGVMGVDQATAPYANKFIFLFMGGFMIARAVERWNLHRRIALLTVLAVGTRPSQLVAGFMLATAGLSMWISNTAATVLMLPIGMSLVTLLAEQLAADSEESGPESPTPANFATCLMLGIAYSASIGGLATLVGTPTNAFLLQFAENQGLDLGFWDWMVFATPLALVMLGLTWLVLTHVVFPLGVRALPGGRQLIRAELDAMGGVTRGEWTVLIVFSLTALCWIFRQPLTNWDWLVTRLPFVGRLHDSIIAMVGAIILFVIPVDAQKGIFALDWKTASKIPWGVLLLFGGGFSLAAAVSTSHLADWIGSQVAELASLPTWIVLIVVVTIVIFLTELTSNTPTAAAFLPILFGVAVGMDIAPMLFLVPATLAASCAFMLPVATPPNAIVFGSGWIAIKDMSRAGLLLNLLATLLIPIWVLMFGQDW